MALPIPDTPLQLNLRFPENPNLVDDVIAPGAQLTDHPVVGTGNALTSFGVNLSRAAGLLLQEAAAGDPVLQQEITASGVNVNDPLGPLAQIGSLSDAFASMWVAKQTQDLIVSQVETAIRNFPNAGSAHNFAVHVPQQGTLSAEVDSVSQTVFPALFNQNNRLIWPGGGAQLTLQYVVPGFAASFTIDQWIFTPSYNLTFDGELLVSFAIAADPRIPPHVAILLKAINIHVSGSNVAAAFLNGVSAFFDLLAETFTFEAWSPNWPVIGGSVSDQSQAVPANKIPLLQQVQSLWLLFAQAYNLGFTVLEPLVTPVDPAGANPPGTVVAGNTVQLRLVRGQESPPVTVPGQPQGFIIFQPQIDAFPAQVVAGGKFLITVSGFPANTATQLSIQWVSPSPFVAESRVAWGQSPDGSTPPDQSDLTISDAISRNRYSPGVFTTPATLLPNATYAFLVQDFDLATADAALANIPQLAGEESAWEFQQTDWSNTIEFVLGYEDTLLASATLGNTAQVPFTVPAVMPGNVSPGTFFITAYIAAPSSPQNVRTDIAVTSITVVESQSQILPSLQMIDPVTLIPVTEATPYVSAGAKLTLRGFSFATGPVVLTLDSQDGIHLGTTGAAFQPQSYSFITTVQLPGQLQPGPHVILADQGGLKTKDRQATLQVLVTPIAQ
jgi:hypothetical protein